MRFADVLSVLMVTCFVSASFAQNECLVTAKMPDDQVKFSKMIQAFLSSKGYTTQADTGSEIRFNLRIADGPGCPAGSFSRSCYVTIDQKDQPQITGGAVQCIKNGFQSWESDTQICEQALGKIKFPSCSKPVQSFTPCLDCALSFEDGLTPLRRPNQKGLRKSLGFAIKDIRVLPTKEPVSVYSRPYYNIGKSLNEANQSRFQFQVTSPKFPTGKSVDFAISSLLSSRLAYYEKVAKKQGWSELPSYFDYYIDIREIVPLDEELTIFYVRYEIVGSVTPADAKSMARDRSIEFPEIEAIINILENKSQENNETIWNINSAEFISNKFLFLTQSWSTESSQHLKRYDWKTNQLVDSGFTVNPVQTIDVRASSSGTTDWAILDAQLAAQSTSKYDTVSHKSMSEVLILNFSIPESFAVRQLLRPSTDTEVGRFKIIAPPRSLIAIDLNNKKLRSFSIEDIVKLGSRAQFVSDVSYADKNVRLLDVMIGEDIFLVEHNDYLSLMRISQTGETLFRDVIPISTFENSHGGSGSVYSNAVSYLNGILRFKVVPQNAYTLPSGGSAAAPVFWEVNVMSGEAKKLKP